MHDHSCYIILSVLLYCISVERQICCLLKSLHIYTLELFSLEYTEGELCQNMEMLDIAPTLPKQSMVLEYEETQEAESISRLTLIVGEWVRNT